MLAIIGFPPFPVFISKFLIVRAFWLSGMWWLQSRSFLFLVIIMFGMGSTVFKMAYSDLQKFRFRNSKLSSMPIFRSLCCCSFLHHRNEYAKQVIWFVKRRCWIFFNKLGLLVNWVEKKLTVNLIEWDTALQIDELRSQLVGKIKSGKRLVQFFGDHEVDGVTVYAIIADDNNRDWVSLLQNVMRNHSITLWHPNYLLHQCLNVNCLNNMKSHRKDILGSNHSIWDAGIDQSETPYEFFSNDRWRNSWSRSRPIHAGIIEPGHLDFLAMAKKYIILKSSMAFSIEEWKRSSRRRILTCLSRKVVGIYRRWYSDRSLRPFVRAMESAGNIAVSRTSKTIRTIALELNGSLFILAICPHFQEMLHIWPVTLFLARFVLSKSIRQCQFAATGWQRVIAIGGVNYNISSCVQDKIRSTMDELKTTYCWRRSFIFICIYPGTVWKKPEL